jgi:predicted aconitase with swiveling domain
MIETFKSRALVEGTGRGRALVLEEPLSLWGGLDPQTGEIIDRRHPQCGKNVAGRALAMTAGKGSSSASSILLEAVRAGTAPAAIILAEADAILALGAAVAREMYSRSLPVVVLREDDYAKLRDDQMITVYEDGTLTVD